MKRFVVIFSVERVIAVYFPLRCARICSSTKNKMYAIAVIILGVCIYIYNIRATHLEQFDESTSKCVPHPNWLDYVKYVALFDILITMIVPFVIICLCNIFIAMKLTGFFNPVCKSSQESGQEYSMSNSTTMSTANSPETGITNITNIRYSLRKALF